MDRVRILLIHEDEGWGAGSPDLPEFVLLAPTIEALHQLLPDALKAHCGKPVVYEIVSVRPSQRLD